jgi:hypothetical protein
MVSTAGAPSLCFFAGTSPAFARGSHSNVGRESRNLEADSKWERQERHYGTIRPSGEVVEAVVNYLKVLYQQLPGQIDENVLILEYFGSKPEVVCTVRLLAFYSPDLVLETKNVFHVN